LGSAEWLAGAGFVLALTGALATPLFQLAGVVAPLQVLVAPWIQLTGIVIALVGIATMLWAQIDMGDSWRMPTVTTPQRSGVSFPVSAGGGADQSSGISSSISASQIRADMSDGARQSPRGDSEPP
jgi:hypothetical protein